MRYAALTATAIVLVHFVVSYAHGAAHERLGVDLNAWQTAFVWIVIVVAPLVAAMLFWTRMLRGGALLLGVSMLGSLLFGLYFHFVAISPDHVQHLPAGDAQGLFVATAVALVPIEAIGSAFGFWAWARARL